MESSSSSDEMNTFNHPFYLDDDPYQFCDDEPVVVDHTSHVNSSKVAIKAVPERPAVTASESVSQFTVLVGLKAPPLSEDEQRAPTDIVALLDVSRSMKRQKLRQVKKAVHFVIDNLGVSDRLSIVAFSREAKRLLPLRRMTEDGREDAHKAVDRLIPVAEKNIVKGLRKAGKVLDERRHRNPVASIIFLSDGKDTFYSSDPFMDLLPSSIIPRNGGELATIPVHSFGFGPHHDPVTMKAISDASGGTFSLIGSIKILREAFAGCIGGLLSVTRQEVRLNLRSASHGVEIKHIHSGRYPAEIKNQGSEAAVKIGDLYADEEKEFLVSLSVPKNEGQRSTTTLLDITCSYKDADTVQVECDIRRPEKVSSQDMVVNMEVDRQRNRLSAAESIEEAHEMAEAGDLEGATELLGKKREDVVASESGRGGDSLCLWLADELEETEMLMGCPATYKKAGRAFALSGMSSHAAQRATTRCGALHQDEDEYKLMKAQLGYSSEEDVQCSMLMVYDADEEESEDDDNEAVAGAPRRVSFGGYVTPNMAYMVEKAQHLNKKD